MKVKYCTSSNHTTSWSTSSTLTTRCSTSSTHTIRCSTSSTHTTRCSTSSAQTARCSTCSTLTTRCSSSSTHITRWSTSSTHTTRCSTSSTLTTRCNTSSTHTTRWSTVHPLLSQQGGTQKHPGVHPLLSRQFGKHTHTHPHTHIHTHTTIITVFVLQRAYLSHCPNRFPDFQQLIELDEVPEPYKGHEAKEKSVLYQVSPLLGQSSTRSALYQVSSRPLLPVPHKFMPCADPDLVGSRGLHIFYVVSPPPIWKIVELGTRHQCRDNVTMFSGQKMVDYGHIHIRCRNFI